MVKTTLGIHGGEHRDFAGFLEREHEIVDLVPGLDVPRPAGLGADVVQDAPADRSVLDVAQGRGCLERRQAPEAHKNHLADPATQVSGHLERESDCGLVLVEAHASVHEASPAAVNGLPPPAVLERKTGDVDTLPQY